MINTDRYLHANLCSNNPKGFILDEILAKISNCISELVKPIFNYIEISNIKGQIRDYSDSRTVYQTRRDTSVKHLNQHPDSTQADEYTRQVYYCNVRMTECSNTITNLKSRLNDIENPSKMDTTPVNHESTTSLLLPDTDEVNDESDSSSSDEIGNTLNVDNTVNVQSTTSHTIPEGHIDDAEDNDDFLDVLELADHKIDMDKKMAIVHLLLEDNVQKTPLSNTDRDADTASQPSNEDKRNSTMDITVNVQSTTSHAIPEGHIDDAEDNDDFQDVLELADHKIDMDKKMAIVHLLLDGAK